MVSRGLSPHSACGSVGWADGGVYGSRMAGGGVPLQGLNCGLRQIQITGSRMTAFGQPPFAPNEPILSLVIELACWVASCWLRDFWSAASFYARPALFLQLFCGAPGERLVAWLGLILQGRTRIPDIMNLGSLRSTGLDHPADSLAWAPAPRSRPPLAGWPAKSSP